MEYISGKNLIEYDKSSRREAYSNVVFCVILVALFLVLLYYKTFVFMVVSVKGKSMYDTLNDGDLLIADRTASYARGDVIVFYDTEIKNEALIKRVIAVGGDTVWSEDGYVYLSFTDKNGRVVTEKLNEDYVYKKGITEFLPTKVPDNCIFVLGDNRENSSDSRFFGVISEESVLGVVTDWSLKIKDSSFVSWYKRVIGA